VSVKFGPSHVNGGGTNVNCGEENSRYLAEKSSCLAENVQCLETNANSGETHVNCLATNANCAADEREFFHEKGQSAGKRPIARRADNLGVDRQKAKVNSFRGQVRSRSHALIGNI
jgi:hypothetical protein